MATDRLRSGCDKVSLVHLRMSGTVVYMPAVMKQIMTYLTILLLTRRGTSAAIAAKQSRPALCHLRSYVLSDEQDLFCTHILSAVSNVMGKGMDPTR